MALQSSGAISLNDIHIEAGGTTGTQASINDADIRALIGKASGVQMSFSEWYGASSAWTITMTLGYTGSSGYYGTFYKVGFISSSHPFYGGSPQGSLTDTTCDKLSNVAVYAITWDTGTTGGTYVTFSVAGNVSNAGFTTLTVNGNNYTRSSANYSYDGTYNYTSWGWSLSAGYTDPTTNPWGSGGTNVTVSVS